MRERLITRRQALLGGVCLCCMPSLLRSAQERNSPLRTQEIAPGIHIRRGAHEIATADNHDAIANLGFIVGRQAVAVFDPGGSLFDGERLRRRIREITSLPIRYVVMSHVHPDHILGAAAFLPDEPTFVGHARLPDALAQRGDYYRERVAEVLGEEAVGSIVQPTMLVESRARIDLGERVLELFAHPIAHTNNDLTAFDPQTRTLFASDLLFVERVPSLDGSLKGWLEQLPVLISSGAERAVPGHGPASVEPEKAVVKLRTYLERLLNETRRAIAEGVDIEDAPDKVALDERDKWTLFDEYHGHNVVQAFKELEWE